MQANECKASLEFPEINIKLTRIKRHQQTNKQYTQQIIY